MDQLRIGRKRKKACESPYEDLYAKGIAQTIDPDQRSIP
jgi:hypothetical protein